MYKDLQRGLLKIPRVMSSFPVGLSYITLGLSILYIYWHDVRVPPWIILYIQIRSCSLYFALYSILFLMAHMLACQFVLDWQFFKKNKIKLLAIPARKVVYSACFLDKRIPLIVEWPIYKRFTNKTNKFWRKKQKN